MTVEELITYINDEIKKSSDSITNTHDLLNEIENIISYSDDMELVNVNRVTNSEYLVTAKIPDKHLTLTFQVTTKNDEGSSFYLSHV
jgi:hypothetical protein